MTPSTISSVTKITDTSEKTWSKALGMLPEEIAADPSSKFQNEALAKALYTTLKETCSKLGVERLSTEQYLAELEQNIEPTKVRDYLCKMNKLLTVRQDNPYHGGYHSRIEVPFRVQDILHNLSEAEKNCGPLGKLFVKGILYAAAPTHDLLHSGAGYAQRLLPEDEKSNEEHAVTRMVPFILEAGLSPLIALEMQRVILPTAFFQKPEQLGLHKDPEATVPSIQRSESNPVVLIKKSALARDYDPDISTLAATRKMAQVLALGDVLVTMGTYEEWTTMAGKLFLEARVAQGFYPKNADEFAVAQASFLRVHVRSRLDACKEFLNGDFYDNQCTLLEEYAVRLENSTKNPNSDDGKFLAEIISGYMNTEDIRAPNLDGF